MLVLSRKVGETLVIGDNITVEIVRIKGNRITLGLVAPTDVKILRGELDPTSEKPTSKEFSGDRAGFGRNAECKERSVDGLLQAS